MKPLRFCKDIGMFAIDRPKSSCVHASEFCRKHCYNNKLYGVYGNGMRARDKKNEDLWRNPDLPQMIHKQLSRAKKQTKRVRLMTRGEAFSTVSDIVRVARILDANPGTVFWIPTRAWTDASMRRRIEEYIMTRRNVRVLASIDPTMPEPPEGWSTMFFGDDDDTDGRHKCPKTHGHKVGACATCRSGCFAKKRADIHLCKH